MVNSGGCTNDNGMKTSLIIEQSAYIGVVQSNKKLPMVRSGRQHSDNALKCFRDKSSLGYGYALDCQRKRWGRATAWYMWTTVL